MLVAASAGVLAGVWFARPRLGRVAALLVPAISIMWTLLRLYLDPPVFALDAFGGYFPGPIYDEALRPSALLAWFRLANLTWVAAAVALTGCLTRAVQLGPPEFAWLHGSTEVDCHNRIFIWGIRSLVWLSCRPGLSPE
jgi:hypothetical protein